MQQIKTMKKGGEVASRNVSLLPGEQLNKQGGERMLLGRKGKKLSTLLAVVLFFHF